MSLTTWLENHLLTCPVKSHFGIDCPGCGLQRSWLSLLNGDILESLRYHPAGILILLLFIFTPLHLIFKFKYGAKIIVVLFIAGNIISLVHYALKLIYGFDYLLPTLQTSL